ncbi:hypothetical protein ACTMU2_25245 [Cupriavidus basilensis]
MRLQLRGEAHIVGDRLMLRRPRAQQPAVQCVALYAFGRQHRGRDRQQRRHAVTVAVVNDGQEIPPDLLPAIFDRFSRGDKSRVHGRIRPARGWDCRSRGRSWPHLGGHHRRAVGGRQDALYACIPTPGCRHHGGSLTAYSHSVNRR